MHDDAPVTASVTVTAGIATTFILWTLTEEDFGFYINMVNDSSTVLSG